MAILTQLNSSFWGGKWKVFYRLSIPVLPLEIQLSRGKLTITYLNSFNIRKKELQHMTLEIQVFACDRNKKPNRNWIKIKGHRRLQHDATTTGRQWTPIASVLL
jgi:hypothetical protein